MIGAVKESDCPYTELLEMTRDVVDDEFDAIEVEPRGRREAPPGSRTRQPVLMPVLKEGGCDPGGCGAGAGRNAEDERGGSWS
jgi:hypothetical protein